MKFLTLADWTGVVETELFARTYQSYGLNTVRYRVLEITATVEPFENGRGFTLRVLRADKPRTKKQQRRHQGRRIEPLRSLLGRREALRCARLMQSAAAKFRQLEADKIIETVKALHDRIEERFPGSGLGKVVGELQQVAEETVARTRWIQKPHLLLRCVAVVLSLGIIVLLAFLVRTSASSTSTISPTRCRRWIRASARWSLSARRFCSS